MINIKIFIGIIFMGTILLAACAPSQPVEPSASAPTAPAPTTVAATATAVSPTKIPSTATAVKPTATPSPTLTATAAAQAKEIVIDDNEPVITFAKSGGYAGIEEEWQIYGNGRIVNERGQTWPTSPEEVTQLLEDIAATGFLGLEGSYMPKNSCCDHFTYVLTVTYEGTTQQVTTIDGAPNTPEAFWQSQMLVQDFIKNSTTTTGS